MADIEWKEEYPGLAERLGVLEPVELPASLSSRNLFEKMDRMAESTPRDETRHGAPAKIFRWRPVMSYAAAFLLLVAVYYGVGMSGNGVALNQAPAMAADTTGRAAPAAGAPVSSSAAAYAIEEDAGEDAWEDAQAESAEGDAEEKGSQPDAGPSLMMTAPDQGTAEYEAAARNTVLVVPALGAESTGQAAGDASQAFAQAELVACGTLSSAQVSHYSEDSPPHSLPWGEAVLTDVACLKGEAADGTITFTYAGGYVPATEYYEQAAKASANAETVKEGLEGKYVKLLLGSSQPELVLGRQYVVMLTRDEAGLWQAAPVRWSILDVVDGVITGPEGEAYGTPEAPEL